MSKTKEQFVLNTLMPIVLQLTMLASGFIIPRLILQYYGSAVNGLVSSISQFLSVITFLEAGVGSVIRFNLYKPLANSDTKSINAIMTSACRFFRNIARILVAYILVLLFLFPFIITDQQFDFVFTSTLIISISISTIAQYYFGQANQILLTADQKGYIQSVAQIISVIVNTISCVLLMRTGASIQIVKLSTSIIYLIRPIFLQWYVNRHYAVQYNVKYDKEPISQKWNGLAQHICSVVLDGTDVIVLTALSTLTNVSIYSAYHLVLNGIRNLLSASVSGIEPLIGNIIAKNGENGADTAFKVTENVLHTITSFVYGCAFVLIVPFIKVYTKGVNDAEYVQPIFAFLLTLAGAGYGYRLPYSTLILSAGHYKQTQNSYLVAAALNIIVSVLFVKMYGLCGVAVGTIVAIYYQVIWMGVYTYKKILKTNTNPFLIRTILDIINVGLIIMMCNLTINTDCANYFDWIMCAMQCAVISAVVTSVTNICFFVRLYKNVRRFKKGD